MKPNNKIDYIEVPAKNIEATKNFFKSLFGWSFTDYGPDYTSFNDGRITGGFFKSDQTFSIEKGCALLVFYQNNLISTMQKVTSLGGIITKDIYAFPGGKRFHFLDVSGNEYAIWSEK
ncbi:MAG: VOC family protein [Pseudomonadota bacterium]